jgi:hypothetical protein
VKTRTGRALLGVVAIVGLAACGEVIVTPTATQPQPQQQTQTQTPAPTPSEPSPVPAHGPVTRDVLAETPPWVLGSLDVSPAFIAELDAFAKAGPLHLVISNMSYIPALMRQAGFEGSDNCLYFVLSRTIAGFDWAPSAESQRLYEQRPEMTRWWTGYINAVIGVMQQRPDLTVTLIVNDGYDVLGRSLGRGTYELFPAELLRRVEMGQTVPD